MPMDASKSLRRRLPLLISTVLCLVVLGVCISAYHQFKVVLLGAAEQRILAATQQLGSALEQSTATALRDGRRLAAEPVLLRALDQPSLTDERSLRALFERERGRSRQLSQLTLVRRDGRAVATIDSSGIHRPTALTVSPEQPARNDVAAGVGPLVFAGNGIQYDLVTPVLRGETDTVGFVASRRRAGAGSSGQLIGRLIGSDAQLLFGNNGSGQWTDLKQPMSGPPRTIPVGAPGQYTAGDGTRYLTAAVRLSSTPWLVLVQIPRDSALVPARRFLVIIVGIAVLMLALGMAGAWRLSRQITEPLAEIASAADEFATGNYARRAVVTRRDELGVVGRAFNAMAAKVEASAHEERAHTSALESTNRELRESEERYRQLVDLMPDAILVHRDGTILFGNAAAASLFGAPSAYALAGRSFLDLVPPDDRESVTARIIHIQNGRNKTALVERTLRRLDDTSISVETAGLPLTLDGRPTVLTLVRDVTQRKRLEEQFRQSQKMEAVGQLAGGVAHDFNNLLTVIMSYSGMLISTVEADSDLGRDLGEIGKAAERAAALTHQLLAFSRRQVLQPRPLDLNALTEGLESMLRRLLREDIELVHRLAPGIGWLNADPGQIEQVIVNLVVNARDAMPDGGRLVVETSAVDLDEDAAMLPPGAAAGRFIVLAISDSGHGMDEATRTRIFDPFFTTKEPGKGTGLGLSTVYGIVQQSGGSISVYSEPGIGTTFKMYLPCVAADAMAASTPLARHSVHRGSEVVLLVEDDASVRGAAERVLARAGYTVMLASTGDEALELLAERRAAIGVVLTDLVMPKMGGRELAGHIAQRWPELKIIFMSGYTEDAASRSSVLAPGSLFLDKPFTPETLTQKVREALQGDVPIAAD